MAGHVCLTVDVVDPLFTYKMIENKLGNVNNFIDKKWAKNAKINKKRVNNTKFKTILTIQRVLQGLSYKTWSF